MIFGQSHFRSVLDPGPCLGWGGVASAAWYWVLHTSLGHSAGWKPPKVNGGTGQKCPPNRIWRRLAQIDMAFFFDFDSACAWHGPKWPEKGQKAERRCVAGFKVAPKWCNACSVNHKPPSKTEGMAAHLGIFALDRFWASSHS